MERAPWRMWNAGGLDSCGEREKDVLGRVDGSCRCHGSRAMERAPWRMWNAGGLGSCRERLVREEREKELLYAST
ncbi:hypothetical protein NDU88_000583 [Pleurodeles waltl]|uniref:Uncharacterized protein n=1 Tax=Pleurodeles waltl TaxID=8319 RepID=A0AAV7UUG5_PLEWA|nr:hypothetical protein NDU88_000583 [Pleurodeles waltl]